MNNPFLWNGETELSPVPSDVLLEEVSDQNRYEVTELSKDKIGHVTRIAYRLRTHSASGEGVDLSLRLCLSDESDRRIVFSIPGGAGIFPDDMLLWLARTFGGNHAAIDWVSRGQSPKHKTVVCLYDPLFLQGDSFRECYMYHNTISIWGAINWLFSVGYMPTALVGGSWGGVYSHLLSCFDRRIERIYSTFGCGGFYLPHVGRRNLWDNAIEYIGRRKAEAWFNAFDPLLRLQEQIASVYMETATNDKFFSLGMIGETWKKVIKKNCFALSYNQDHSMRPYGKQPYIIQSLDARGINHEALKKISFLTVNWEAGSNSVLAWPINENQKIKCSIISSEQAPNISDMSRAWIESDPKARLSNAALFDLKVSNLDANVAYYIQGKQIIEGEELRVTTPIFRNSARERGAQLNDTSNGDVIWSAEKFPDVWLAPIGDKTNPRLESVDNLLKIQFFGHKFQRFSVYGIQPWRLSPTWKFIEVEFAGPIDNFGENFEFFICKNFHRWDESAMTHDLSKAHRIDSLGGSIYRFFKNNFKPGLAREDRFGTLGKVPFENVLFDFDAAGFFEANGKFKGEILLKAIRWCDEF